MIILGIDPGVERIGFALLEKKPGISSHIKYIDSGTIFTNKAKSRSTRFLEIFNMLHNVVEKYRPNCLALEELYFSKNVSTATSVAQSQGVIYLLAAQSNIEVRTFAPNTIKMVVTGDGKADKNAVKKMVHLQLVIPEKKRIDDEYDAIACAMTCLLDAQF